MIEVLERRSLGGDDWLYTARPSAAAAVSRVFEFIDGTAPGAAKRRRWVMTLAVQSGCPVGCAFCDAGAGGYRGNLEAGEIVGQALRIASDNPELDPRRHPRLEVRLVRMGEPSLNPGVLEALRRLAGLGWPGLTPSLSTVAPDSPAIRPFFEALLRVKEECFPGRLELQFSLHGVEREARRRVVPLRTWPLEAIAAYGARFRDSDRKLILHFALDGRDALDPEPLLRAFSPGRFRIKLAPVNATERSRTLGFAPAWTLPPEPVARFAQALSRAGFEVGITAPWPEESRAGAACGQVGSERLREEAAAFQRRWEEREALCR